MNQMIETIQNIIASIRNFINTGTPEEYRKFALRTEKQARQFEQDFSSQLLILPQQELELNQWFFSREGRETLLQLMEAAVVLVSSPEIETPGHDARHFIKSFYSGLRLILEDSMSDYRQCFLIAAFLHDIGRLIEEKTQGALSDDNLTIDHAQLSFGLASQLFMHFTEMPQIIKDHMLYTILVHQRGTGESFFAQAVQRCDREQLTGPEAIQRMFACDVGLHGLHIHTNKSPERRNILPPPGTPEDTEVMPHIEFYMRNLYTNIGTKGELDADKLKIISGIFLFIATPEPIRNQIFAPELADSSSEQSAFKKPLSKHVWQEIKKGPDEETKKEMEEYGQKKLEALVEELVRLPHAAVADIEIARLHSSLAELSDEEKSRLREGLAYAIVMRKRLDEEERKFLANYPRELLGSELLKLFDRVP